MLLKRQPTTASNSRRATGTVNLLVCVMSMNIFYYNRRSSITE